MGILEKLCDDDYPPIEDYGIIGDLKTCALVGPRASIECLCWPRFDSPSIFACHVDRRRGGRFQIWPQLEEERQKRIYVPDTNVLLSRFLSREGIAEVSDFMWCTAEGERQALVRRAKAIHGEVSFLMACQPAFNYGRDRHRVEIRGRQAYFTPEGADRGLRLNASIGLEEDAGAAVARFTLREGETASFVLESAEDDESPCVADGFVAESFKETSNYWRNWLSRSSYRGRWQGTINRSALALKLLTSREFGSIIAAPCFGFPNHIGGERNWDYRYTWLRDASFTVYALMRLGFTEETEAYMGWIADRCRESEHNRLSTMYHLDGTPVSGELALDHFEGYMRSKPVRIGSTNHDQLQLDVYGELLDSVYLFDKFDMPVPYSEWQQLCGLVEHVVENWMQPDASIWEVRSANREFLYSRVMCWVAIDRALRLAHKRSLPAPVARWRAERDKIYHSVYEEFWNPEREAFVQFRGADALDASTLIMPLVKFISPIDPRWKSTLKAIEEDLVTDSLVYRYRVGEAFSDELEGKEGTFSICSLWLVEAISRSGDVQRARFLFEKMLSYGNDLKLFSEQLGHDGRFLGNIPQALTHLALISAAFELDRKLDAADPAK